MQQAATLRRFSTPISVRAIVVDLDGTLLHSAPQLAEAANRMLREMDYAPVEQLLLIGDSPNDTLAARAAGCPVFCVPYGYNHGEPVSSLDLDAEIADLPAALPLIKRA
ncbi:MAG: HAD hydrolase-like protein [Nitrosomonadales bacterium]|nr:HAD hydrolase-like protein [Nitrosomonadales bacterium]